MPSKIHFGKSGTHITETLLKFKWYNHALQVGAGSDDLESQNPRPRVFLMFVSGTPDTPIKFEISRLKTLNFDHFKKFGKVSNKVKIRKLAAT